MSGVTSQRPLSQARSGFSPNSLYRPSLVSTRASLVARSLLQTDRLLQDLERLVLAPLGLEQLGHLRIDGTDIDVVAVDHQLGGSFVQLECPRRVVLRDHLRCDRVGAAGELRTAVDTGGERKRAGDGVLVVAELG